ncbi:hypothetical protein AB0D14_12945 [Streptomyces sp. NPDC048484]|uniref:hypothetical protein n=1 Tax=Streptomyces sp. NPDC048484 TaxID=3155146 RepID=UPI003432A391
MSPDRFVPRTPRQPARQWAWQRGRQRWLVALAAMLCAVCAMCAAGSVGGHAGAARTAPPAAVSTESGIEHQYDILDSALRPPARQGHRPLAPLRPAHRLTPERRRLRVRALPPLRPAPSPHAQRCVVLRC